MLLFIANNLATIIIGLIVAGVIAAVIVKIVRDLRKGKCAFCDSDCGNCSGKSDCGLK